MAVYGKTGESGQHVDPPQEIISELELVLMNEESPSVHHTAQEDGSWVLTVEREEELFAVELKNLDSLQLHILRHERNGESERAARAELEFNISQAEIMEKYGRGETVYVTENGECYHRDRECLALANATEVVEVKLSDGLKNYTACSICCN